MHTPGTLKWVWYNDIGQIGSTIHCSTMSVNWWGWLTVEVMMIPVKMSIYIKINNAHTAVPRLSMFHSIENDKLKAPDIISVRIIA